MTAQTRFEGQQGEMRTCPYCLKLYPPKRARQEFCGDKCRNGFHMDVGTAGKVAGATRIKRGVSIVLHFPSGPAAERAILLLKGQAVRLVSK